MGRPRARSSTATMRAILGAPFYLMERRRGIILRRPPAADQPIRPRLVRRLCETLVDSLARLHSLDYGPPAWATSASRRATSSAR